MLFAILLNHIYKFISYPMQLKTFPSNVPIYSSSSSAISYASGILKYPGVPTIFLPADDSTLLSYNLPDDNHSVLRQRLRPAVCTY